MAKPKSNLTVVTDDGVASCILDILRNAKEEAALISPDFSLWGDLKDQIIAAKQRGIQIYVGIRGPDDGHFKSDEEAAREKEDIDWLLDKDVLVFEVDWLHSNIYMNEEDLIVSSMNLTEDSTTNVRDIALVIHDEEDQRPIREYTDKLAESALMLYRDEGTNTFYEGNWSR